MSKILGDTEIGEAALEQMRKIGGGFEGGWAVYQNHDMGHHEVGHLRFIRYGADCTLLEPPTRHPDTRETMGWRYLLVGKVDLETGEILEFVDESPNELDDPDYWKRLDLGPVARE